MRISDWSSDVCSSDLRGQSLGPSALPEGPGKEQVESVCTACHPASQITRSSGYTQADWSELTATMIDLSGNPELREEITGYLAAHFPPNQRKAAIGLPTRIERPITTASFPDKSPSLSWSSSRQRSEEHTSELQSLMRISYAVFCLKKKKIK